METKPSRIEFKQFLLDRLSEANGTKVLLVINNGVIKLWFEGEDGTPVTHNVQEKMLDLVESMSKWLNGEDDSGKEVLKGVEDRSMLSITQKYEWED